MKISFVVAVSENNCIGKDNDLPWHIPEDLKHFRKITDGGTVLMGRKTFESIVHRLGKPLPNRTNVVLTRDKDYKAPEGVMVFNDIDTALSNLDTDELFVIGGGKIFESMVDKADKLYVTHVNQVIKDGDAFFPKVDFSQWKIESSEDHDGFRYVDYVKK